MSAKPQDISILVIDDNEPLLKLIKAFLRMHGYRNVTLTLNAEQGFGMLCDEELKFDLVIVDWALSGMNGIEFTKKVRTDVESLHPHIPVILLTGHSERSRVEDARDAGVTEFLAKPISDESLANRVKAIMGKPRHFIRAPDFVGPDRRRKGADKPTPGRKRRAEDLDND